MPSRWLCMLIVAFWLGMMGWLAGREWWIRYGAPPTMYTAMDAATSGGLETVTVKWRILGNEQLVGTAETGIHFESRANSFVMHQTVHLDIDKVGNLPLFQFLGPVLNNLQVKKLTVHATTETNSFGDVNRFALHIEIPNPYRVPTGKVEPPKPIAKFGLETRLKSDGKLWGRPSLVLNDMPYQLPAPLDQDYALPYRVRDVAFGSLCPLDRMPGLRPGQTWQTPVADPSSLIMFGMPGGEHGVLTTLMDRQPAHVRVLPTPEVLQWKGQAISCWIVVTDQDNLHLRIWVQQSDGLILKQSAEWGATKIDIIREATETPN